jgi:hypothetical protein
MIGFVSRLCGIFCQASIRSVTRASGKPLSECFAQKIIAASRGYRLKLKETLAVNIRINRLRCASGVSLDDDKS